MDLTCCDMWSTGTCWVMPCNCSHVPWTIYGMNWPATNSCTAPVAAAAGAVSTTHLGTVLLALPPV
jgi:hypothetical protein